MQIILVSSPRIYAHGLSVRLGCFYGATCILVLQAVFYYQAQTVLNSHQ